MGSEALHVDVGLSLGRFALDVALEVPPGITVLFGPSGSGKSTTLAAIAGLVRPVRGRVAFDGTTWFDAERHVDVPPERRRVSLVFQSLALFPHLTTEDNVAYGIDPGIRGRARERRALAGMERMKVAHVARRRPGTLSGGEAQRVALARALARDPCVLLLDEAFSALDAELRAELGAEVRSVVSELSIPAIVVTHDRSEARSLGERIVSLRDGRVLATDDVRG